MPREFELSTDITVDATPKQVWAAIATGPGIDSWFMGRTEVAPGEGGSVRLFMGAYEMHSTITAWEPPHRLEHRTGVEADGTFRAFEYVVEGRDQGSTVVRTVLSGFLGHDDWESEYDALSHDGPIYPFTLGQYLTHFLGRDGHPVTGFGATSVDRELFWRQLIASLGLAGTAEAGNPVRLTPDGLSPIEGVVDYRSPSQLGVRSDDGLYRFVHGLEGVVVIGHHLFAADVDQPETERAWQSWIERSFT